MTQARILMGVLFLVSACTESTTDPVTKEEARQNAGKSDDGFDWCAELGWYGDGICDDFCVDPDPDCTEVVHCGGFAGFTCGAGQYCHYERGEFCGIADQMGDCRQMPGDCTFADPSNPVCGCDGMTYVSECHANLHGTGIRKDGACALPPPDECQPVLCELFCENGFATDDNGCEICSCAGEREIASGWCVKNSLDSCETDADCVAGGCGGELCYNPADGGGISTCECVTPSGPSGCGCVEGKCAWYN